MSTPLFFPVSASALLMTVGSHIDVSLTRRISSFVALIDAEEIPGIIEVIPSYTTVLVEYEPSVDADSLRSALKRLWSASHNRSDELEPRVIEIPVCYGGPCGEDLDDVAAHTGLAPDEVVERHVNAVYTVGALGFSPGFAYLIGLPPELATPRRARPRLSVPPGSIGIGGAQTGMYALASPGGWSLIGRSPKQLFNPDSDYPLLLRMGDEVRFRAIAHEDLDDWPMAQPRAVNRADRGDIEVITPGMQTTVQDLGRSGHARFGVARNGAADRSSLIAANRLVGNPDGTAALEITILGPHLRFHHRMDIALAGADLGARMNGGSVAPGTRMAVIPGDELTFPLQHSTGARAYLSFAGGIDVPEVMGSRSTDLTARLGGYHGRSLQAGDHLAVGRVTGFQVSWRMPVPTLNRRAIGVAKGPQADQFSERTWKTLVTSPFTVTPESNRVGLRLAGPSLKPMDSADIISEGIVTGSIQVTGEGQPIVMLPGHATIGGYTKIATVVDDDLDRLGQLRPGDTVRFREEGDDRVANWSLGDMLRFARVVSCTGTGELSFEDHATGARLRLSRRG